MWWEKREFMSAHALREKLREGHPRDRIGLALDDMDWRKAQAIMRLTSQYIGFVKVNSLARSKGIKYARQITQGHDFELMGDAKCHDTRRTLQSDVVSMTSDGVRLITVHGSAVESTQRAARESRDLTRTGMLERLGNKFDPFVGTLLGITVLTDHDEESCIDTYGAPIAPTVLKFALRAQRAGLDGFVCGVPDLSIFQAHENLQDMLRVVPGIILPGTEAHSGQQRIGTPYEAILAGADYIILGSAVTKALDPERAAQIALQGVKEGLADLGKQ